MNESTATDPSSQGSIQVLPQEVVDRIAAGEVVQRPSAVVKEVLENSLDAGSTEIVINAENGGLTKMVITDNGCGIGKIDLEIANNGGLSVSLYVWLSRGSSVEYQYGGAAEPH
jgi:2-polyprenyl-3-methyl-5-hydroxy-6-metoxy-1,4-benzoquinol methylase